jgi:hypothetical protein
MRPNKRPIPLLLGSLCFVVVFWFIAFFPLIPVTKVGWLVELTTGTIAFFWVWACIEILVWLERPRHYRWIYRLAGVPVALSFGARVFVAVFYFRDFIALYSGSTI